MSAQSVDRVQDEIQTVTSISQVDVQISELYTELEKLTVQLNPDISQQQKILNNIDRLQQLKISLYNNISQDYASAQSDLVETRDNLVNDVAMTNILNDEIANVNSTLSNLKNTRDEKVRMAEINNYYSSKYDTQTNIMKTIVYCCIPLLILGIMIKKDLMSQTFGMSMIGIIVAILIIVLFFQLVDTMNRDNTVYDEYNWRFDPKNSTVTNNGNNAQDQPKMSKKNGIVCIGQECCPPGNTSGISWNASTQLCVGNKPSSTRAGSPTTKEEFTGSRLIKNAFDTPSSNINIFKNTNNVDGFDEFDTKYSNF
jgi:hypothetical protein